MNKKNKAKAKCYENYPFWIILVSNFVSIAIYLFGGYIIYQLGLVWLLIYVIYIAWLEIRLLKGSCVNCYYYGKYCAFGKGKLSCLFFKKGDPKKFIHMQITWKEIIPDFLVSIIPLLAGIVLLIRNFSWILLGVMVLLFVFMAVGNAFVRGTVACKYCKQRELGCPAEKLFSKNKTN